MEKNFSKIRGLLIKKEFRLLENTWENLKEDNLGEIF
jgi:hypothetical protein